MMHKKAYNEYAEKLLKLPMQDTTFIAKLASKNLLPGDTKSQVKAQSTPVNKASYFLNNIIEPSIDIGDNSSFNKLLLVMDKCGYEHVEHLALEIRLMIKGEQIVRDEPGSSVSNSTSIDMSGTRAKKFSKISCTSAVKCPECGENATYDVVKNYKAKTYGHPYYSCTTHDFFEWKNTAGVKCNCGQLAKKEITRKKGLNNGKWFYNCKNNQCNYFIWSTKVESTYRRKISQKKRYKYPYIKHKSYPCRKSK